MQAMLCFTPRKSPTGSTIIRKRIWNSLSSASLRRKGNSTKKTWTMICHGDDALGRLVWKPLIQANQSGLVREYNALGIPFAQKPDPPSPTS